MGMQFLAPVLSQMSSVLRDSIRELVVVVRWGQGEERQEMLVTTHVIDKGPVNQVAAMIQQQTRALGQAMGGAAGAGAGANNGGSSTPQPGGRGGASPPGLVPGVPGGGGPKG
jgi:hypothetical protein